MNREFLKKIFFQSLTAFLSLALAILLFFAILKLDEIRGSFHWLLDVLTPFIYGGTMAYLLKTPCGFLERQFEAILPDKHKKWANLLSVVAVMLISALILYLLLGTVLPEMWASIVALAAAVPPKVDEFTRWVLSHLEGNEVLQNYVNNAFTTMEDWGKNWATTDLLPTMQGMMGGVVTTVGSVLTVAKNIILGVIICIYLLASRKKFTRHAKALVYAVFKPERADKLLKECAYIDVTFVGFFGGKILDSAIVGLICYIFCAIMSVAAGFQNAVLISVIIGVTNVIPFFGPFLGAIPSGFLILLVSPRQAVWFALFVLFLQQLDGNVIGPKILGNTTGLSSLWVITAILVGGSFFGIAGMFFGVPVCACLLRLTNFFVDARLRKKGLPVEMEDYAAGGSRGPR